MHGQVLHAQLLVALRREIHSRCAMSGAPLSREDLKRRCNRNRKLQISRAPTKAKSQEPAYSHTLNQNKTDRQRSRSRESDGQTVIRLWWMVLGVEAGREVWGRQ